jgi:hypothetical protein
VTAGLWYPPAPPRLSSVQIGLACCDEPVSFLLKA